MSAFADLFADVALPALFEQLGESVTYTIGGGAGASITAICREVDGVEEPSRERTLLVERLEVIVGKNPADAVYGGVEQPRIGDKLTRGGKLYAFRGRILPGNAGGWKIEVERPRDKLLGRAG